MGTAIMMALGFVGGNWRAIALGLAVVGLLGTGLYLKNEIARNATLQTLLNQAEQVANDNAQALIAYKTNQDALLKAMASQHAQDVKRLQQAAKLHQQVSDAPKSDDSPVAPVLKRTIDGLHSPSPN